MTPCSRPSTSTPTAPPLYYHYWGKAQPAYHDRYSDKPKQSAPYHLLVYHCLDVAAAAHHLLHNDAAIMTDLSDYLAISKDKLRPLLCFFIALHDLGKFATSFQALYQPEDDDFLIKANRDKFPYHKKHDALGYCFYQNAFFNECFCQQSEWDDTEYALEILFNCVLGHHGKPIPTYNAVDDFEDLLSVAVDYEDEITIENLTAARACIADFKTLFDITLPTELFSYDEWQTRAKHISWQLSGLTMLADWLGSDSDYFPYHNHVIPLADYWQMALANANRCVNDKGLFRQYTPAPFISVQSSFGFTPSPLQAWAESVPLSDCPQLFVLEDITGSGKTEAALTLAHRLMRKGDADGFYFGLPTTATSNAMFERIDAFMPTLYPILNPSCASDDTITTPQHILPSLVLAHGSKNMNDTFQRLIANAPASQNQQETSSPLHDKQPLEATGDTIRSQCHAWFASHNKRALLADIGVGTIDQALLAALPKKHQPLRLFGLHHKVLIFDEVHSADSYMFELLKSLLQVHLHQGGHAILLTATLSLDKREALAKLWLDDEATEYSTADIDNKTQSKTHNKAFPLATQVIAHASEDTPQVNETAIASPARVARRLEVDFLHNDTDVVAYLVRAAQNQQCAVWVRNTVHDAISAYDALLQSGIDADNLLLFHSRFALIDRKRIENEVLICFGKHSTHAQRAGKILIATQVFQESLDADADVMVSDLCPIDYLIQRAGRLHRHKRDARGNRLTKSAQTSFTKISARPKPKLMILAPEFTETPSDSHWYSTLFAKSQYVYQHTGHLWLTMRILMQQRCLDLPKDARLLIESVYSDEVQKLIPEALEADSKADNSQQNRKKYSAKDLLIDWHKGYSKESQNRWFTNESIANSEVGTRYQEMPTCEVVILNNVALDIATNTAMPSNDSIFYANRADEKGKHSNNFAIELSTLKISEKMASKLTKIPTELQDKLISRYRGLKYKQLWIPDMDNQFIYDKDKGLLET